MADGETERELKHELGNARQQKMALQHLLSKAVDEIEDLVESNCDDEQKAEALKAAARFRKAASL
jgi:hypothetical protein